MNSMCFRCEHRAQFLESKGEHRPRLECGDVQTSKIACYMFMPVKPLVVEKLDMNDPRPLSVGYFSCRYQVKDIADVKLVAKEHKGGIALLWSTEDAE